MAHAGTAPGGLREPSAEVLARIRATVEREPTFARRAEPWRVLPLSWMTVFLAVLGLFGGRLAQQGALTRARLLERVPTLLALLLGAAWSSIAATAPWPRRVRGWSLVPAALAAAWVVAARAGNPRVPLAGGWHCTVLELGADVLPLAMMLSMLREHAIDWQVGAAWGLAVGSAGMMVGELGCGGDLFHVLVFHLSAWALWLLLGVVLARRIRPRAYAP